MTREEMLNELDGVRMHLRSGQVTAETLRKVNVVRDAVFFSTEVAEQAKPEPARLKAMQELVSSSAREVTSMRQCLRDALDAAIGACNKAAELTAALAAAQQREAGLRKALKPFVDVVSHYGPDVPNEIGVLVRLEYLRSVSAALAASEGDK